MKKTHDTQSKYTWLSMNGFEIFIDRGGKCFYDKTLTKYPR